MHRINEVVLERKFNTGNYESVTIRASVSPYSNDDTNLGDMIRKVDAEIHTAFENMPNGSRRPDLRITGNTDRPDASQ